jgi:hypothetical protein
LIQSAARCKNISSANLEEITKKPKRRASGTFFEVERVIKKSNINGKVTSAKVKSIVFVRYFVFFSDFPRILRLQGAQRFFFLLKEAGY